MLFCKHLPRQVTCRKPRRSKLSNRDVVSFIDSHHRLRLLKPLPFTCGAPFQASLCCSANQSRKDEPTHQITPGSISSIHSRCSLRLTCEKTKKHRPHHHNRNRMEPSRNRSDSPRIALKCRENASLDKHSAHILRTGSHRGGKRPDKKAQPFSLWNF